LSSNCFILSMITECCR